MCVWICGDDGSATPSSDSGRIEPLPGLETILEELLQEDGIFDARISRQGFEKRVVSQDLQLWLSNAPPMEQRFTLLARAGRQTKFKFCPPDDAWARKNFERRGAAIMKNNLSKVRLTRKRPNWISQKLWKTLNEHWKTPGYKKKRMQAKTNRASDCDGFGKPLHTCGSITTSQHRANLTETNGTPPDPVDLFVYTHQHRKNKTWVYRKSEHVYGKYKHRWEELTQQASLEGNPPPKEIDVWTEVAGIRKGRIYGLGSESPLFASRRNYHGSSSSSTEWVQRHEFEEMKFERDELRDIVKQLMESLKFQPKPYTRDQVHEDDVVDDNEDIVDNNDDNEDVVDNNNDNSDGNSSSDDNDGMSDDDNEESF
ncbi:hypothetical protein P8452_11966 [Trifolium repens]|nr:hypothetical protein P8452_11966 [Trifolium repens]